MNRPKLLSRVFGGPLKLSGNLFALSGSIAAWIVKNTVDGDSEVTWRIRANNTNQLELLHLIWIEIDCPLPGIEECMFESATGSALTAIHVAEIYDDVFLGLIFELHFEVKLLAFIFDP